LRLDGELLPPLVWQLYPGGAYISAILPLGEGAHVLAHTHLDAVFMAIVYGFNERSSFAYLAGSAHHDLSHFSNAGRIFYEV